MFPYIRPQYTFFPVTMEIRLLCLHRHIYTYTYVHTYTKFSHIFVTLYKERSIHSYKNIGSHTLTVLMSDFVIVVIGERPTNLF